MAKGTRNDLTAERLRQVVTYDPDSGLFHWLQTLSNRAQAGHAAGTTKPTGYVTIAVDGYRYGAHRLAWLYTHGIWPTTGIDHINGNPSDNRIVNLREATQAQNNQNRRRANKNSTTGWMGTRRNRGRWVAQITIDRKNYNLGSFATPEEAHACYLAAKAKLHPFAPDA